MAYHRGREGENNPRSALLRTVKANLKGLARVEVNSVALQEDLENVWEVLAEAVQTVMRKTGYSNPYEHMKELTRDTGITKDEIRESYYNTIKLEKRGTRI